MTRTRATTLLMATALLAAALPVSARTAHREAQAAAPQTTGAIVKDIAQLPGQTAVLVTRNGKTLAAHDDGTPLSVGTASRLAVAAALEKAYGTGSVKADSVVRLRADDKAAAGGMLESWPAGTPLTIATADMLMVTIDDTTASDLLMRVLGRKAVDAAAPARDRPYLSAREMFILKDPADSMLAHEWRAATPAARERLLTQVDAAPSPSPSALGPTPEQPQIGWFYTARELCKLMGQLADTPAMGINPGLPADNGWKHVAFVAGAEPGVFSLNYRLEAKNGRRYCVSATWNDQQELGRHKMVALVTQLIYSLPH